MVIQLQNLFQTRQELAGLEERNRLARDLHDSVKQQIFATAMQVGAARTLIDQNPEAAKSHLLEAEQLVRQAQQELATLILELRPAALEGKGLVKALRDYVGDWSRQTHIAAEVRVSGERLLPLTIEQTLFRVVQESLANVARHSGATQTEIYLVWEPNQVNLTIADNGHGFQPAKMSGKGVGLQSMRERIEMLGGRLEVESKPGAGAKIIAHIAMSDWRLEMGDSEPAYLKEKETALERGD
jgi:NarL family two-component system sensor histidine kinase LiaS